MNRGPVVYATYEQLKEFKSSILWKDFRRELVVWKKDFEKEIKRFSDSIIDNNLHSSACFTLLGELNGRIKAIDYVLTVPDMFMQILEDKRNDNKR